MVAVLKVPVKVFRDSISIESSSQCIARYQRRRRAASSGQSQTRGGTSKIANNCESGKSGNNVPI